MGDKERGRLFSIQMDGSDSVPFIIKKDKLLIGRGDSCEIRIYVDGVSPEHCVISFNDEGRGFVEPVTKSCLTFLNGELIERQVSLEHNDVITIVKRSFRFFYPSSSKFYVAIQPIATNSEEITVEDHIDFDPEDAFTKRSREMQEKRVTFGPRLSPEEFDKNMPPASPLRRGSLPADKLKAQTPDTQKSHFNRALFNKLARDNPGTPVEELSRLKVLQSTSVVLHKLRCSGSVEIQSLTDKSEKNTTNSRPLFSEVLKKSTKAPQKNVAANKTLQRYSPKRLTKKALKVQNSKKTFYKSPGKPVHPRVLAVSSTGHANSPETIVIYKKRMTPSRKTISSVKKRKSSRLVQGSLNSRNSRKSISEKDKEDNAENGRSTSARESISSQNNSLDIFDTDETETPEISHTSLNEVYDNTTPRRKSLRPQNKKDSTPSQEKDTNDKHLSTSPLAVAIDSVAQLDENSIDKSLKDIHNAVQALACHSGVSSALNNEPSSSDMCLTAVKKLALTISMVNAFHMYRRIIDDVSGFPLCFPSTSFDSNRENMRCVQRSGAHSNEDPMDIGRMFQDVMRNFFTSSICNDVYDGGRKGMLRSCTNDMCPEVSSICCEDSRKSKHASKTKVALRVIDSACKNPRCKSVHSHHEDIGVFYESDEMHKENDSVFMNESGFCSNCTPVRSSCENSGRESMSESDTSLNSTEATSRSSLSQMKEYSHCSNDAQTSGNKRFSTPKDTNLQKIRKSINLNNSSKKVATLNQSKRKLSLQPKKLSRASLKGSRVSSKSAENSPALRRNSSVKRKSVATESKSPKSAKSSLSLMRNSSVKLKSPRKSVAAELKTPKSAENSPALRRNSSVKLKTPRKSVAAELKTPKSAENSPALMMNSSVKLKTPRKSVAAELKTPKSAENSRALMMNSSVKLKTPRKSVAAESKTPKSAENSPALMNSSDKLKSPRKSVAAESKTPKSAENSPALMMNSSVKLKTPRKSVAAESKTPKSAENSPALMMNSSVKLKSPRKSVAAESQTPKSAENSPALMMNSSVKLKTPRKSVAAESKTPKSAENSPALMMNSSVKLKTPRKSVAAESKTPKSAENSPALMNSSDKLKSPRKSVAAESNTSKYVENTPSSIINSSVKVKSLRKSVAVESKLSKVSLVAKKHGITASKKIKEQKINQKHRLSVLRKVNFRAKSPEVDKALNQNLKSPRILLQNKENTQLKSKQIRVSQKLLQKAKSRASTSPAVSPSAKIVLSPKVLRKRIEKRKSVVFKGLGSRSKRSDLAKTRKRKSSVANTSPKQLSRNDTIKKLKTSSENEEMDVNEDEESEPAAKFKGTKMDSEIEAKISPTKKQKESTGVVKSRKGKEKKATKSSNAKKQRSNKTVNYNENNDDESLEKEKESTAVVESKSKEKKATKRSNARKQKGNKAVNYNEMNDDESLENEKVDDQHTRKEISLSKKSNKSKKGFVKASLTPIKETRNLRKRECVKMSEKVQNEDKNSPVSQKAVEVSVNLKKDTVLTAESTPQKDSKTKNRKGRKIESSSGKNDNQDSLEKQSRSKRKFETEKTQISEKAETPKKAVQRNLMKNISKLSSGNESKDLLGETQDSLEKQSRSKRKFETEKIQISEKAETPRKAVQRNRMKKISKLSSGNESKDLSGETQEMGQKTKDTVLKEVTKNSNTRSLRSKESETTSTESVEVVVNNSQKPDRRRKEYRDQKKLAGVEEKPETVDSENTSQRTTRKRKNESEDKNEISPKRAVENSKPIRKNLRNEAALLDATNEKDTIEVIATKRGTTLKRKGKTGDENVPEGTPKRGKRKRNPVENTKEKVEQITVSLRSLRSRK